MGIRLTYKLKAGMKYNCGFYTSLGDSSWYATKNLGMLFTPDSLHLPQNPNYQQTEAFTNNLIYVLDPQVRYSDTAYLADRIGWMKVDGSFIADGTEEFLYIGNFDPNADTDTLIVYDSTYHHSPTQFNWNLAYYYIDDVYVYEDSTWVGVEENSEDSKIEVYPNPTNGLLFIEKSPNEAGTFELFDVQGRPVYSQILAKGISKAEINISGQPNGLYFCRIVFENGKTETGKLVLQTE